MRGFTGRLHDKSTEVEASGQSARSDASFQPGRDPRLELREDIHMKCPSLPARRLTQVGRRVKKTTVFSERETIGHSGDIVSGRSRSADPRRPCRPFRRHCCGIGCVSVVEPAHNAVGLGAHAFDLFVPIHMGEQETLDVRVRGFQSG